MALSFAARLQYSDKGKREYSVHVQTSKTFYSVAITPEKVYLIGPGLREEYEREDYPAEISHEGLAIMVVLQWEECE